MKVKITTDSASDMLPSQFEELGVSWIPFNVILGDKNYKDNVDIEPLAIFDYFDKNGTLPKTAAINPEDFKDFFKSFTEQGYEVVHISLSSQISLSYQNAVTASKEVAGVHVVDSLSLSTGLGQLVYYAHELKEQGLSAQEICAKCQDRTQKLNVSFVIDTLTYLHKGGRCSSLATLVASVLRLKPTILVREGKMDTGKKYRGRIESIICKYVDNTLEGVKYDKKRIFVTHSHADQEMVDKVVAHLKANYDFQEVIPTIAGTCISSHCGRNTLGILFFAE